MSTTHATPLSYSLDGAIAQTGLTRHSLIQAIHAGHLKARRSTRNESGEGQGKYLIRHADLVAYVDQLPEA